MAEAARGVFNTTASSAACGDVRAFLPGTLHRGWRAGADYEIASSWVSLLTLGLALLAGLEIFQGVARSPLQVASRQLWPFAVSGIGVGDPLRTSLYQRPPAQDAEYQDPTLGVALVSSATIASSGVTLVF